MSFWRVCVVAGLLTFASQTAVAASAPRSFDLEILTNGQLLLRGEIIDNLDDLEAKLRVMREHEPPFELSFKLPKTISLDAFAPIMKMIEGLRARFGLTGNGEAPKPTPIDPESSTI
jgi:hypothetical protein